MLPSAFAQLNRQRLLPVAVLDRVDDGPRLAEALLAAGLQTIEITLRTPVALDAIRAVRARFPEMLVGAGTVLEPEVVPQLVDMGVGFAVAPGLYEPVVAACQKHGLPLTPGVVTPSEVDRARSLGLKVLKFFPAEPAGGAKMVGALAGPYAHTGVRFIPTGGISLEKAKDYWALPIVLAVGGSWFVEKKLLATGNFAEVTRLTAEALATAGAAPTPAK